MVKTAIPDIESPGLATVVLPREFLVNFLPKAKSLAEVS
jgi:hypothetical protein